MSIALKLNSIKVKGVNKITRIPGVEQIIVKGKPKLFGVRYFLFTNKFKKMPLIIRLTSKTKNFKEIYGLDLFDKKSKPAVGFILKPGVVKTKEELSKFISIFAQNTKPVNENNNILKDYLTHLNEGIPEALIPSLLGAGIGIAISLFFLIKYAIQNAMNKKKEYEVAGPAEQASNERLFVGQKYDEPAYKMYANLQNFIKFVVLGKAPAVILCGPPGMSKTYMVKRTFHFEKLVPGKDYMIEKGSALSIGAVYDLLYINRNRILVLDDFDKPLRDEDTVNMLKAITDSYDKRMLSLPREKMMSSSQDSGQVAATPSKFEYRGKLIIITNLKKREIDRALLSRAPAFEVTFNTKEVFKAVKAQLKFINPEVSEKLKQEVFDYINILYAKNPKIEITFRSFKCAIDARVGNPLYWKEMVKTIVGFDYY